MRMQRVQCQELRDLWVLAAYHRSWAILANACFTSASFNAAGACRIEGCRGKIQGFAKISQDRLQV